MWATLLSYPSGNHFTGAPDHAITTTWLSQFRDLFGGYCSDEAAAKAALRDKSAPYAAHTNPWRLGVGGCEHTDATATTHTITGLDADTAYQVRVVAFNARGEIVSFGDVAVSTTAATTTDAMPDLPASSDHAQL